MSTARTIQKNVTRPTSVAILLLLFQGFKLTFPKVMDPQWEDWTYNAITVVAGTGILDKIWTLYGDNIKEWFLKIFKKKQNG